MLCWGPSETRLLLCIPSAFRACVLPQGVTCMSRTARGVAVLFVMVHKSCTKSFFLVLGPDLKHFSVFGPEANLFGMDFNEIGMILAYLFGWEASRSK